jgi:hypothetical protein
VELPLISKIIVTALLAMTFGAIILPTTSEQIIRRRVANFLFYGGLATVILAVLKIIWS